MVGGVGGQPVGDDDLMGRIDRDLAIVAGDEAIPRGLDAAVGIGEVALRLVGWRAVLGLFAPAALLHAEEGPGPSGSRSAGSVFASASRSALAARMRASRLALSAIQPGVSSPRRRTRSFIRL